MLLRSSRATQSTRYQRFTRKTPTCAKRFRTCEACAHELTQGHQGFGPAMYLARGGLVVLAAAAAVRKIGSETFSDT